MELNAAPASQPADRLVELERQIRDLTAAAAGWGGKAAAASAGSAAEERYLKAYSEVNAQLLELQKQRGLLLQSEAAGQAGAITEALAEIRRKQAEIGSKQAEILLNTALTKRMVGQLCSQRVQSYMDPSSTNSSTIQQDTFRNKVTGYYGYSDAKDVPQLCMLTGREHDWHDLVAGHIVPRSRAAEARADVNIKDINDPRNGIFWSRAVEGAWTAGIFCFASPAPDVFKFKLLDKSYSHQRVQDWPLGKKALKSSTKHELGDMTWGQLHATAQLQFLPKQCGRPYRRALCFMARMALLNSSMQSWVRPDDVDSQAKEFDYMSEDGKIEATIAWINELRDGITAGD